MLRRDVLKSLIALAAVPTAGFTGEPGLALGPQASTFTPQILAEQARMMASLPYAPRPQIPESWRSLSYDQYRSIWFDARNALWNNTALPQRVDVLHRTAA